MSWDHTGLVATGTVNGPNAAGLLTLKCYWTLREFRLNFLNQPVVPGYDPPRASPEPWGANTASQPPQLSFQGSCPAGTQGPSIPASTLVSTPTKASGLPSVAPWWMPPGPLHLDISPVHSLPCYPSNSPIASSRLFHPVPWVRMSFLFMTQ